LSTSTTSEHAGRRGELRSLVRSGVRWKVVSGVVVQVTRILTAIVIARFVSPADFGLAALALVFSALATDLADLGLGAALVQRASITAADRSTVFWTSVGVGAALTVLFAGLSVPISDFYGESALQPLLAVYSLTFLLNGVTTTQATLLTRDLRFRSLELRVIVATLASAPIGIALAVFGAGAWAIIGQSLAYAIISLGVLWAASPWRPQLLYSFESLRDLGGFGLKALGDRLAWLATNITDTILIGRFLGPAAVGAYSVAFNLTTLPVTRIAAPLRDITFSAFSRIQDDRAVVAAGWLRATTLTAGLIAPAMLGMIVVAPIFVPVVLGPRWDDAIPVIQALSWVGLLVSLQQVGGVSALLALNRASTLLRFTVSASIANIAAFVVGLSWGIVGVAIAYAGVTTVLTPVLALIAARAVGSSLREYASHVLRPLLLAAVMGGCVLIVRLLVPDALPGGVRLAIVVTVGALAYLALCARFFPTLLTELRRLLPSRPATAHTVA